MLPCYNDDDLDMKKYYIFRWDVVKHFEKVIVE